MSDQKKGAMHLTDDNFQKTIQDAKKPVMVDFFADWCGPCQMAAPVIDKLADEYKEKILVTKLNVDEASKTAQEYGVMSIPTVIILEADDKGELKELDRLTGFPGEAGYKQMIEKIIKK